MDNTTLTSISHVGTLYSFILLGSVTVFHVVGIMVNKIDIFFSLKGFHSTRETDKKKLPKKLIK